MVAKVLQSFVKMTYGVAFQSRPIRKKAMWGSPCAADQVEIAPENFPENFDKSGMAAVRFSNCTLAKIKIIFRKSKFCDLGNRKLSIQTASAGNCYLQH